MKLPTGRPTSIIRSLYFWDPTPSSMRGWALASVVVNAGIAVTGATVRVTESGLGCPTWPQCTSDSYLPVLHPEISPLHMAVEFGNRLLTFLVLAVGFACVIAALRTAPRRPDLVRLAWVQPAGIVVQALWGGLVVRTALHPATVGMHYIISVGLMAACWMFYVRTGERQGVIRRVVHRDIRRLAQVLLAAVFTLLVAGVLVTGTGPHSGDELASRFDLDIESVARVHADIAYLVVGLTFALLFALHVSKAPRAARRAALALLGIELLQGVIGYTQYFLGVPAFLVGLHVLGSTLVWIFALRAVTATRVREPVGTLPSPDRERAAA
ncbi:heme A synthase [Nonomuraea sp. NPDC050790]|uniref:heme A synthase n=1 Tax=Nonomuraea sp. NPDC050790 TaxID=3364371 RepID=UPI003790AA64